MSFIKNLIFQKKILYIFILFPLIFNPTVLRSDELFNLSDNKSSVNLNDYMREYNKYTILINKYPNDFWSIYNRAVINFKLNKFNESRSDINKAISISNTPNKPEFLYLKALLSKNQKNFHQSIKYLDKLIIKNPSDINYYLLRASLKNKLGEYSSAIDDYNFALTFDKNNFKAILGRSRNHFLNKSYQEAIQDINLLINSSKDNIYLYKLRADYKFQYRDWNCSIKDYDIIISKDPKNIKAYTNRSISHWKNNDFEKSCKDQVKLYYLGDIETRKRFRNLSSLWCREMISREIKS